MDKDTKIIIAAPAEFIETAIAKGQTIAHMIFRIGRGYHLFRAQGSAFIKGGLMVLDTGGFSGGGPISILVSEILRQCETSGFTGIVLDTGGARTAPLSMLADRLGVEASNRNLTLYIPESLADAGEHAVVLLPTALSGGTLRAHIRDAQRRYGKGRVALEIERVRMDFTLPASSGTGKELSAEDLQNLLTQYHPQSFLSIPLCTNYFTYHDKKGVHFVLYDNSTSIHCKLGAAADMGIDTAFMFYPHVSDIIDKILA